MMRELKGMESMSSSRLLMELGGVVLKGFRAICDSGWRVAHPCKTGESEGLEWATGDAEV